MIKTVSTFLIMAASAGALSSSFLGQRAPAVFGSVSPMRMDSERFDLQIKMDLDHIIQESTRQRQTVDQAQAVHGMPWATSIDPSAFQGEDLLYMPFWNWQMEFMKEQLTDLKVISCSNQHTDFGYNENLQKKARIVNVCVSSKEYRKIRMTYYDAGDGCQVFNAVWYPDPAYNLPVLGIDLLAFNRKKYLAIVDFQPLHQEEGLHAAEYEHLLAPIKAKYDSLKGQMSSKFYDETQFFSQQMLFSRFEDEKVISDELFPAFTQYVQTHLQLIRDTPADPSGIKHVMERQQAYDTYSAERDPATGLFCAMFGNDWAQDFVHDFLFSLSVRKEATASLVAIPSTCAHQHGAQPAVQAPHRQAVMVGR
jgi:15,16-dihydrobiliverdin:ferredoxin oxidoreductase